MDAKRIATVPPAAARLKYPHQTVYGWILGQFLPHRRDVEVLAKRIRMNPDELHAIVSAERKRKRQASAKARTDAAATAAAIAANGGAA